MSYGKQVLAIALASLLSTSAALAQQKPANQPSAASEQSERKLIDATSNLEGELKQLNRDLDALIDKAAASPKTAPASPGQRPAAPASPAPR